MPSCRVSVQEALNAGGGGLLRKWSEPTLESLSRRPGLVDMPQENNVTRCPVDLDWVGRLRGNGSSPLSGEAQAGCDLGAGRSARR